MLTDNFPSKTFLDYQVEKKAFFSKGKYRKFTKRWQDYLHLVEVIDWDLSTYIILWIIIYSFFVWMCVWMRCLSQ